MQVVLDALMFVRRSDRINPEAARIDGPAEAATMFENLDFVAHVYEMAASSGQEPRPASQHQLNAS